MNGTSALDSVATSIDAGRIEGRREESARPFEGLRDEMAEPAPAEPVGLRVPRPVDHERLAPDLLALDEAPVAAVLGVVPIVAHHEVRPRGDEQCLARVEIPAVGGRGVAEGPRSHVWLVEEPAVQPHAVVTHLDGIATDRDDALDEVTRLVVGILED